MIKNNRIIHPYWRTIGSDSLSGEGRCSRGFLSKFDGFGAISRTGRVGRRRVDGHAVVLIYGEGPGQAARYRMRRISSASRNDNVGHTDWPHLPSLDQSDDGLLQLRYSRKVPAGPPLFDQLLLDLNRVQLWCVG